MAALLLAARARTAVAQVVDPTFPMVNGLLGHVFPLGDTLYVGGDFTWIGEANGSCVALDASTGAPIAPWPRVEAGMFDANVPHIATAVVPDGSGGCYVAGSFESISGVPRYHLAHVRGDGSVDGWNPALPSGWYPMCMARSPSTLFIGGFVSAASGSGALVAAVDIGTGRILWTTVGTGSQVLALALRGARLYAGGYFSSLGGAAHANVAALDPASGVARPWDPDADAGVLAIAANDSTVFVGGLFSHVGGAARVGLAALDAANGSATSFDAAIGNANVKALALSGTTLYVGGSLNTIGGQTHGPLAAVDAHTGSARAWNPYPNSEVDALTVGNGMVYVGGYLSTGQVDDQWTNLLAFDEATGAREPWESDAYKAVTGLSFDGSRLFACGAAACGGRHRLHAAAIDLASGHVTDWAPDADHPAVAFAAVGDTLFVGGYFAHIAGQPRNGIAAFSRTSGALLPWNPAAGTGSVGVGHMVVHGHTLIVDGWAGSNGVTSVLAGIDIGAGAVTWTVSVTGAQYFEVNALLTAGTKVFVLGDFYAVNGIARRSAAALDASSGALSSWDAQQSTWFQTGIAIDDYILLNGGPLAVDTTTGAPVARPALHPGIANALALDGTTLYVAGVDSYSDPEPDLRSEAEAFDVPTGTAVPWHVGISRRFDQQTLGAISIAARNGHVWLAGDFNVAHTAIRYGLAQVLPADVIAPVASVAAPADGALFVGATHTLTWAASDDQRILSSDLLLSRSGPLGPWELIAGGLEGVSSYDWKPTGPASDNCWLRVNARDLAGNQSSAVSATGFTIVDTTSTLAVGEPDVPSCVALSLPSPAPASTRASIAYVLSSRAKVALSLFDIQGREIAVLDRGVHEAGRQVVAIDAGRLRPGLYLIRLHAGATRLQQRLLVVR